VEERACGNQSLMAGRAISLTVIRTVGFALNLRSIRKKSRSMRSYLTLSWTNLNDGASVITKLLKKLIPHKQIGWEEIGEDFIRFQLLKTPWFNLYLHRLWAPQAHPECHDHPWWFYTIVLKNGYFEYQAGDKVWYYRLPGAFLYRPANFSHNVITPWGVCWSLVLTGPKVREWGFHSC
jgi:hypothetical protein